MPDNLWGNIELAPNLRPPVTILREQAEVLSNLTNKILEGEVVRRPSSGSGFNHALVIRAPSLNYTITIVEIFHGITLYPLKLEDSLEDDLYECGDEGTYIQTLAAVLSSDKVHDVISALIAQTQSSASL